jgi:hypothetical protein
LLYYKIRFVFRKKSKFIFKFKRKVWNFPAYVIKIVETIASKIDDYFPYPFNEEIRGIAEASNSNVGDIVFANLIYDITA